MPQKFLHLHMMKVETAGTITFLAVTIYSERPVNIPADAELMILNKMTTACEIVSPHNIKIVNDIVLDDGRTIQSYVEKFIGTILAKIFKRVKQFIEKVRI